MNHGIHRTARDYAQRRDLQIRAMRAWSHAREGIATMTDREYEVFSDARYVMNNIWYLTQDAVDRFNTRIP